MHVYKNVRTYMSVCEPPQLARVLHVRLRARYMDQHGLSTFHGEVLLALGMLVIVPDVSWLADPGAAAAPKRVAEVC